MRIIIAGSRDFPQEQCIRKLEVMIHRFRSFHAVETEVVCGLARGPDIYGMQVARKYGIAIKEFPADWEKHGKRAGSLRNQEMGEYAAASPDGFGVLWAFWDQKSTGTRDMISRAKKLNLHYFVWTMDDAQQNLKLIDQGKP